MNEQAMMHVPDSQYCFPAGEKEVVLRLRMAKGENPARIDVLYACKYEFSLKQNKKQMEKKYTDRLFDFYEVRIEVEDARLAYIFQIEKDKDIYFYSEDGISREYDFKLGFYNFFQLPFIQKKDMISVIPWMKEAVFYQIFVDRFERGDFEKEDAYINMEWGGIPTPKSFAGGDLKGIEKRLPYLQDLGINVLYLTPVFKSVSNHKYDISDYYEIDRQFGTKEDLKRLVKKAHKMGIRIVLDAVFNHCSSEMMQFQDVLRKGKQSPYYDWFCIDGEKPDMEKMNYECFASCNYMPKLNTANEETKEFLLKIAQYWIKECDIDGWRLDVSDEISHDFWREFRKCVKAQKKDAVIFGENWHDARTYLQGDQYDSIMNYAFTKACLDYFAFGAFNAEQFAEKLNSLLMRNLEPVNRMMINLLDSHDTLRFFTEVKKDKEKALAAAAVQMFFTGVPCIYYGTEICMEGGYDPDSRRGFNWKEEEWDKEFFEKFKRLIQIRKRKEITEGSIAITAYNEGLLIKRQQEEGQLLLFVNETERALPWEGQYIFGNKADKEGLIEAGGFVIAEKRREDFS